MIDVELLAVPAQFGDRSPGGPDAANHDRGGVRRMVLEPQLPMGGVQSCPGGVIVGRPGRDGGNMGMGGRFECLLNVIERHRLAGDERASLGIAEPERNTEARRLRTEVPTGLVIGMFGFRGAGHGQRDMPDRSGPGAVRIVLHQAVHRVALRCEVGRGLRGLPELLPVVDAGAQGEEAGEDEHRRASRAERPQRGEGDEKRGEIQTVGEGFFPIDHVQRKFEQQQGCQHEAEAQLAIHSHQPPESVEK